MPSSPGDFPGIVIFGGVTEGRLLAEWCSARSIPAIYCAATPLGALTLPHITMRIGRLNIDAMIAMLRLEQADLVIDATHPYAAEVSANILKAAEEAGARRLRITRAPGDVEGCRSFQSEEELSAWLSTTEGVIFGATGLKEARLFSTIPDFKSRVYFRLLPSMEGLKTCLELGFPPSHIIMMYGPFSRDLNFAMFQSCGARILVTKDSGGPGGFAEKLDAAKDLGMEIALLSRPAEAGDGYLTLEQGIAELEQTIRGWKR